jgi:putative Mg2+ transporter-C (MgtC) family protein
MSWGELVVIPPWDLVLQVVVRLVVAAILGGIIGMERMLKGKPAGLRTQMLVCMASASVLIVARLDGIPHAELSRVIDGILTGIGFIGGGVILKLTQEREILGVTTAASIWATAAVGIAVGLGALWIAVVTVFVVWVILFVLGYFETHVWKVGDGAFDSASDNSTSDK